MMVLSGTCIVLSNSYFLSDEAGEAEVLQMSWAFNDLDYASSIILSHAKCTAPGMTFDPMLVIVD
jgi:hypothetical protein